MRSTAQQCVSRAWCHRGMQVQVQVHGAWPPWGRADLARLSRTRLHSAAADLPFPLCIQMWTSTCRLRLLSQLGGVAVSLVRRLRCRSAQLCPQRAAAAAADAQPPGGAVDQPGHRSHCTRVSAQPSTQGGPSSQVAGIVYDKEREVTDGDGRWERLAHSMRCCCELREQSRAERAEGGLERSWVRLLLFHLQSSSARRSRSAIVTHSNSGECGRGRGQRDREAERLRG